MTYEEIVNAINAQKFKWDYIEPENYCDYDYKGDDDGNLRHYPQLRRLGNYDSIFTENGNIQTQLQVFSRELDLADDRAIALRKEVNPSTATKDGMLPFWEKLAGISPTNEQSEEARQKTASAALYARGGLSREALEGLAVIMGYNIGQYASIPRLYFEEGNAFKAFIVDVDKAGHQIWEPTNEENEQTVTVYGTNVTVDKNLQTLLKKNKAFGVTMRFINI